MCGLLGLALTLPAFSLDVPWYALVPIAALFGASATAQLTPASALLEKAAADAVGEHPTLSYALFNCAYVGGMAVGPGALASLTDALGFRKASLCLSASALAIAGVAAAFVQANLSAVEARRQLAPSGERAAGASNLGFNFTIGDDDADERDESFDIDDNDLPEKGHDTERPQAQLRRQFDV
jgi:MFS family permease